MRKTIKGVGKKVLASALSAAMVVAFTPVVAMANMPDSVDNVITLSGDTSLDADYHFENGETMTIDLAGHTLSTAHSIVVEGANLTIMDSSQGKTGKIVFSGTSSDGLKVYGNTSGTEDAVNSKLTVLGGTITNAKRATITVFGKGAELDVRGGTIENTLQNTNDGNFAIAGNGKAHYGDIKVSITGGTITSAKDCAVYFPNSGTYSITGGSISGYTGIEIDSGDLTISGDAAISSTYDGTATRKYKESGDGNYNFGAALAIVTKEGQYNANGPMNISITGGTLNSTSYFAIDEYNLPAQSDTTGTHTGNISSISISGGTLTGSVGAVLSDTQSDFIHGGSFSDLASLKYIADGATYGLSTNVSTTSNIMLNKSVTIDLNGHELSRNNGHSIFQIVGGKTLTMDATDAGSRVRGRLNAGQSNNDNGNIVIKGGTYTCAEAETVLHINGTCLSSNVSIKGATINSPTDNGIQLNGAGTFLIEDSTITGATAVYIKSGTTTIRNSALTGTMTPANYQYYGNGANPTGDAIVIDACNYPGGDPTVNILSGAFTGSKNAIGYYQYPEENPGVATISVTGGTFSSDPSAFVKYPYSTYSSGGKYIVYDATPAPAPEPPAPEVGETTEGVEIGGGSTEGTTGGSTKVDITVTDNTATTDSKGNKVDGTVSIDKIESTESSVTIPETITTNEGTFLVTSIPAEAMKDNTTVERVTIPESVTSIGESAFAGCTELTSVTVPAGVTEIKDSTFAGCTNLETVEVQGEVTSIAPSAFENCTALTTINMPDTVTTIGESAFAGCTSLTSVSVPAGVATIEPNTFANCTNLSTVEVKGELTEIAADAFNGCTNLTSMTVAGTVKPMAIGTRAATGSLVIPESVTKVGDRAFKGTGITSVTVPAGVKMGTGVFRDCKQLTKASVEKGVKTLSSYTFKGCSALKSVTVPSGVTKIERSAFSGCKNLTKVTLPKTVTSIGKNALYGASKVKTLTVNSKKLTKSGVKGSLAGSKVTTVKVPKSMVSAYKKIFTKANCGKTVKVRAI